MSKRDKDSESSPPPLNNRTYDKTIWEAYLFEFFSISLCVRFSPSPLWLSSSKNICNKMLQGQELQQILQMLKDNMLKFKQIHARACIHMCVCVCLWLPSVSFLPFCLWPTLAAILCQADFPANLRHMRAEYLSKLLRVCPLARSFCLLLSLLSVCMCVCVWCFTFKSLNAALMPFYFRASQLWVSPA